MDARITEDVEAFDLVEAVVDDVAAFEKVEAAEEVDAAIGG